MLCLGALSGRESASMATLFDMTYLLVYRILPVCFIWKQRVPYLRITVFILCLISKWCYKYRYSRFSRLGTKTLKLSFQVLSRNQSQNQNYDTPILGIRTGNGLYYKKHYPPPPPKKKVLLLSNSEPKPDSMFRISQIRYLSILHKGSLASNDGAISRQDLGLFKQ